MLTVEDFTLRRIVCEVRYPEAFLLYDRAGTIFQALRQRVPDITADQVAPHQLQMSSTQGVFVLELGQCRVVTTDRNFSRIENFTGICSNFFTIVIDQLELSILNRIGLRSIYTRRHRTLTEAQETLNGLKLIGAWATEERFGAAAAAKEFGIKWEGSQVGAGFTIKAETIKIEAKLPPELDLKESEFNREFHQLTLDVDYYTVASVERSQWDPETWIPQSSRIVKKESNKILGL